MNNEAAFDQLLHNPRELAQQDADAFGIGYVVDGQRVAPHRVQLFVPAASHQPQGQDRGIELAFMGVPPGRCLHEFDCDASGANWSIWRCRHCGAERRR